MMDTVADEMTFPMRFARLAKIHGPLVFGLDPSAELLVSWGLTDDSYGLDRFVDIVIEAAIGSVGVVKPQSAYFERLGWRGWRTLARLVDECRSAGVLVLMDAKRGDIGSTNDAYAETYFGARGLSLTTEKSMGADAVTLSPYLGPSALAPIVSQAASDGGAVFIVVRSSNQQARAIQQARLANGETVEEHLLSWIAGENARYANGAIGPVGAVLAPNHGVFEGVDLSRVQGLFLAPGLGAQGASIDDIKICFEACPDRVLPSASRSLLKYGPDVNELRDSVVGTANAVRDALGV